MSGFLRGGFFRLVYFDEIIRSSLPECFPCRTGTVCRVRLPENKAVCPRAEADVWGVIPVGTVVDGLLAGAGEIGDFVVVVACCSKG